MATARLTRTPTSPLRHPIAAPPRPTLPPARMRRKRPWWQRAAYTLGRKDVVAVIVALALACVVVPMMALHPGKIQVLDAAPPMPEQPLR